MSAPRGLPAPLTDLGRTLVLGVLNVTPDSFSDGGQWLDPETAVAHGKAMVAAGADLVDVGGESTRPGAAPVSAEDELARILPVVRDLAAEGVHVSIDTLHASTAEAAVAAGACLVNDVSGGAGDPAMPAFVAAADVPYVVMHRRGTAETMQDLADYDDVVADVRRELTERLTVLTDAGVDPARLVVDPGLGFAKLAEHNWALLRGLPSLQALGFPVMVGASRKRFLGELFADPEGNLAEPERRDPPTAALTAILATTGVWAVRVHEVGPSADAVRVASALMPEVRTEGRRGRHAASSAGDPPTGSAA